MCTNTTNQRTALRTYKFDMYMRELTYREAIAEATVQAMEKDPTVFVFGVDVDDPKGIFGTTRPAFERFGRHRVFGTPVSENALTGIGIGAGIAGMRPILVHARNDFVLLTMDQLVNNAAKWKYMYEGKMNVPLVVRAIIGRGWGQGAQHSQSLQAMFAQVPGLTVVMPSNAYDAKGLLVAAIEYSSPVIFLEHRMLFETRSPVPEEYYALPLGRACIVRSGADVTVAAVSEMVSEAIHAADILEKNGISLEVIDLRTVRPYDEEAIFHSVQKTGRLIAADTGSRTCGFASELVANVAENQFHALKSPPIRIANPDTPTPVSHALESHYYPGARQIVAAAQTLMGIRGTAESFAQSTLAENFGKSFTGPF